MKKLLIVLSLILVFVPVTVFGSSDFAMNGDLVTLGADEEIDRDFFASGERVEIFGTINGDLYVAGGEVIIEGTVHGDVLAAAGVVRVLGSVGDDIRAAGGELDIRGDVGGNVTLAGGDIRLDRDAFIEGSVVIAGGEVSLNSPIEGNVVLGAGLANISSLIEGDVDASIGELRVTSQAEIGGDLTYWSDQEARINESATISGVVEQKLPKSHNVPADKWAQAFAGAVLFGKLMSVLGAILVGLIVIRLFPHYVGRVANNIEHRPWASLGIGLIALIVTPVIATLLLFTVFGIPLALMLWVSYFVGIYLALIYFMLLLGRLALRPFSKKSSDYLAMIIGAVLYGILTLIPVLNFFVFLFALLSGLGSICFSEYQLYKIALKKEIV